jgi:hypothetical protein
LDEVAAERRDAAKDAAGDVRPVASAWRDVVVVWVASRAFFLIAGGLGHAFLSPADSRGVQRPPRGVLSYWANWDGAWFTHIAQHHYALRNTTVFFPLYPLAVRAVMALGPGAALAGVLVSVGASLGGLYFVYQLGVYWWDVRVARAATLVLAFFPTAFYLNAVYSESLLLAQSAGSVWALYVRRDLLMAGVFGYLAAITRNAGVLLVIPLASDVLRHRREARWDAISVLGPPLGLLTYAFYLRHVVNYRWLEFVNAERVWERHRENPLLTIKQGWGQAADGLDYVAHPARIFETTAALPPFELSQTINFACLLVIVALLAIAFIRLPFAVALYAGLVALAALALPETGLPLRSLPRFALVSFPLFLVLGSLLARSRIALSGWLACTAALGVYLTLEFVTWRWVA